MSSTLGEKLVKLGSVQCLDSTVDVPFDIYDRAKCKSVIVQVEFKILSVVLLNFHFLGVFLTLLSQFSLKSCVLLPFGWFGRSFHND